MSVAPRIAAPCNGRLFSRLAASAATFATASPLPALRRSISPPLVVGRSARWSSSNSQWKQRQGSDHYARKAKVEGLKSRAAFKLVEMDTKFRLFRRGQTVVDLGYAPGSWSQIAKDRTKPNGRVVGIDLIPAQPPKGVSTIQGNFLSPVVQSLVKDYLVEFAGDRAPARPAAAAAAAADSAEVDSEDVASLIRDKPSYIDTERAETAWPIHYDPYEEQEGLKDEGRLVDVVLSDMSAPWPQTYGFRINTISKAYSDSRMMNTSGMPFRDHAGSMVSKAASLLLQHHAVLLSAHAHTHTHIDDLLIPYSTQDLCLAALRFASDTLRSGGHFVCKFYAGAEDKDLEGKLKKMFGKVYREKPDSSRSESREAYFVALRRKGDVTIEDVEQGDV
ncbi:ribosomal RNA large subunit methyltransferase J [Apiospora marii]|uniref:ribosomal RNA large subunit methyltransferase J n=1 Tax=Apiospora marii TaxID=335849 RepID=UPI00312F0408